MKICAIVVTYNRGELLEKQIKEVLFNQELKVDSYYIIDNCSSDNTYQIVEKYENDILKYRKLEKNIGGAGGFSEGLKLAYNDGFDWYILMDDDGCPFDSKCFFNMKAHIRAHNYKESDLFLLNSLVLSDENFLSFGLEHMQTINEIGQSKLGDEIKNKINPFNGTWVSNGLINKIGFPNKDFFIKGDENDYIRRALNVNAYVATIVTSKYFHPRVNGYEKRKVLGHEMYVYIEEPWKEYYSVRNYTYSFFQLGQKKEAFKFIFKRIYCVFVCKCRKMKILKMIIKGYMDGKNERLGKRDF